MRAAVLLLAAWGVSSCGSTPPPVAPTIPPAPPADVSLACALPEVAPDAYEALVDHRLALVECRGAALLNDEAWRRVAGGR